MQTYGAGVLEQYIDVRDYLTRRATALGLPIKGLVKSEEQLQAAQQQAQQASMVQQFGPQALDMAREAVTQPPTEE